MEHQPGEPLRRLRCGQPPLSSRGSRPRLSLVRTVAPAVGRWTPARCVRPGAALAVRPHWTGSWCLRRPCRPRSFQRQLLLSMACVAPGPLFSAGVCPGLRSGVEPSLLRCMAGSVAWWLWMDSCPLRGGYLPHQLASELLEFSCSESPIVLLWALRARSPLLG